MHSSSFRPRFSPSRIRSSAVLTLVASVALVACNSDDNGSNGGGGGGVVIPASLGGAWNFFLDGTDCDGDVFSASSLEITETSEGQYLLQIGALPEVFEFPAERVNNTLTAGGTSSVGGVTLTLESAVWTIAGNGHKLSGAIETTRTEAGISCPFTGEMEAFQADATQTSLARGDWEWAARTSAVSGSCTTVGSVQAFDVTLWPKRQNQFVLDLGLPTGEHVQFDASVSGARMDFFGSETLANGDEMSFVAPSFVTIAAGGAAASGEMNVSISGSDPCDYSGTLTGARPAVGEPLLPFVRDIEGTQALMAVRPEDPSESIVLVDSLGSEALVAGVTAADVARFAEIVERPVQSAQAGGIITAVRDAMVYTAGGDIYWVDLAQRFDVDGGRIVLPPVKVFSGNGSSITDLAVYVDRAQTTTVIVGDRTSDRFMIELGIVAQASASALLGSSTEVIGMLMNASGEYRGMATLVATGSELRRLSVEQSSDLIATGVTEAAVSPGGALYYARTGQLAVIDAGETVPTILETLTGASYTFGRFEGERLFAGRDDTAGAAILSRAPGAALVELAQTASVAAGGAVFSDLVPVEDRVVFTMRGGSGTRRFMAVPKAGGMFQLLVAAPDAEAYDLDTAQVMNRFVYFGNTSSSAPTVFGLRPFGAIPEDLADHELRAPFLSDVFAPSNSREPNAITFVGPTGSLLALPRTSPTNGALTTAEVVFTSTAQDGELVLAPMGNQMLFAERDASQTVDQQAPLYWVDLSSIGTVVQVSGEPGEFNLPIR